MFRNEKLHPVGTRGADRSKFVRPDKTHLVLPAAKNFAGTMRKLVEAGEAGLPEVDIDGEAVAFLASMGVEMDRFDGSISLKPGYGYVGDLMPR